MKTSRLSLVLAVMACGVVLMGAGLANAAPKSLYARLGGYDAISAVTKDVVSRLAKDDKLKRFWAHRGNDGIKREVQLLIDFIVNQAGGPLVYTGRDMKVLHEGMRIDEEDWKRMMRHLEASLDQFKVPMRERKDVIAFFTSTKKDIVEVK